MNYQLLHDGRPTPEQGEDKLLRARQAAQDRDAARALELLAESGFLDGLVRRVQGAYPDFEGEEIVATGVGRLYVRIADTGKRPLQTADAYLLKAVFGLAKDEADRRRDEREAALEHDQLAHRHEGDAPSREVLRNEAVRVARPLLPRLGQENVQAVMAVVLDAVEEGEFVSPSEIGELLDLAPNTVSKTIERGIRRLGRVAQEAGVEMTLDYAMAIEEEFEHSAAERGLEDR
jgi:DNA-directed RNA polymerase specialized sigma24 family protein